MFVDTVFPTPLPNFNFVVLPILQLILDKDTKSKISNIEDVRSKINRFRVVCQPNFEQM